MILPELCPEPTKAISTYTEAVSVPLVWSTCISFRRFRYQIHIHTTYAGIVRESFQLTYQLRSVYFDETNNHMLLIQLLHLYICYKDSKWSRLKYGRIYPERLPLGGNKLTVMQDRIRNQRRQKPWSTKFHENRWVSKILSPPYWVRHFEFRKSEVRFIISDPKSFWLQSFAEIVWFPKLHIRHIEYPPFCEGYGYLRSVRQFFPCSSTIPITVYHS